jgi:hypothetical protein
MNPVAYTQALPAADFELRFRSLFNQGRAMAFPCDAQGHVDLDALSEIARENYFYARTVVGREYAVPAVMPASH